MHDREPIEVVRHNSALLIRFVRPERRNSLSSDVLGALESSLEAISLSSPERVVFTGSGGTFASGADLREIKQLTPRSAREFAKRGQALMAEIATMPILTVAAISGYCLGGGFDLAIACKKRIASRDAIFSHPGVSLGIITGWGGTQRLPRLVGEAQALEMLLTAERVEANEALRIGLLDQIADDPVEAAFQI
jgi:enoyl-CoA hydratase/carnithine racemase